MITHRLNINPKHYPIRQKHRVVTSERFEAIKVEVDKLLKTGFISSVEHGFLMLYWSRRPTGSDKYAYVSLT